jgi:hypothetical protein
MPPNLIYGAVVLIVGRLSDRVPTYVLVSSEPLMYAAVFWGYARVSEVTTLAMMMIFLVIRFTAEALVVLRVTPRTTPPHPHMDHDCLVLGATDMHQLRTELKKVSTCRTRSVRHGARRAMEDFVVLLETNHTASTVTVGAQTELEDTYAGMS